jgi:hypothetical protein
MGESAAGPNIASTIVKLRPDAYLTRVREYISHRLRNRINLRDVMDKKKAGAS